MNFQFHTPTQLVVGLGKAAKTGEIASVRGTKAFAVVGASINRNGHLQTVIESLASSQIKAVEYVKPRGEPTVQMADEAATVAKKENCDFVVSIGGGSTIDLGKAVSGLLTNDGSIIDYLEGVGIGKAVLNPSVPHIAIPTTAGAGAEMTRNAVIRSKELQFKKSFRSPFLYPAAAILDAGFTEGLPPGQTAYSGMDAITQLIEAYITQKASPLTDALALYGLELAFSAIRNVYRDGSNLAQRENMLLASALSGVCLANAGLGMAHGFASGLGAVYDIPHGKVCAILLPHALKFNLHFRREKLAKLGRLLTDDRSLTTDEYVHLLVREIDDMNKEFNIPANLKLLDIAKKDIDTIVKMSMGNSMSGNPIEITPDIAQTFLESLI